MDGHGDSIKGNKRRPLLNSLIYFLSQWDDVKLCWLPLLVLLKQFELFLFWWLENRDI